MRHAIQCRLFPHRCRIVLGALNPFLAQVRHKTRFTSRWGPNREQAPARFRELRALLPVAPARSLISRKYRARRDIAPRLAHSPNFGACCRIAACISSRKEGLEERV